MELDEQAVSGRQVDLRDEIEAVFKKATFEKAQLLRDMALGAEYETLGFSFISDFYTSFVVLFEMTAPKFEIDRREDKKLDELLKGIVQYLYDVSTVVSPKDIGRNEIRRGFGLYDEYKGYIMSKNLVKIA
ncbi:hypothetical protein [Methanocella sp. MCL-LM]|uniref:hypothetical protein n=1 Tax=Methanocella sp. MCL-LM TaxID=3412035 RepID=UPI003C74293D